MGGKRREVKDPEKPSLFRNCVGQASVSWATQETDSLGHWWMGLAVRWWCSNWILKAPEDRCDSEHVARYLRVWTGCPQYGRRLRGDGPGQTAGQL